MYILKDYATKIIISSTDDARVANHLCSGILDLEIDNVELGKDLTKKIPLLLESENIVKILNGTLVESIADQSVRYKLKMAKIRKPAFELLQRKIYAHLDKMSFGFSSDDEIYLISQLDNDKLIKEYADMLDISKDFALKELKMLSDSYSKERFRLFINASKWKKEINLCRNSIEIEKIKDSISDSFWISGVPKI